MLKPMLTASLVCLNALLTGSAVEVPSEVGAWTRSCSRDQTRCLLSQTVISGRGGPWLNLHVGREGADVGLLIETSPLANDQLIFMLEDARPMLLLNGDCTWARCRFRAHLDPAHFARFASGRLVNVLLPLTNGRDGRLNIDLDGLTDAVTTLTTSL